MHLRNPVHHPENSIECYLNTKILINSTYKLIPSKSKSENVSLIPQDLHFLYAKVKIP